MSEKHLKEIVKELRLIRVEMQKSNKPVYSEMKTGLAIDPEMLSEVLVERAGEQVTIK